MGAIQKTAGTWQGIVLMTAMAAVGCGHHRTCLPPHVAPYAAYGGPSGPVYAEAGSDYIGMADGLDAWNSLPLFGKFFPIPLQAAAVPTATQPDRMRMEMKIEVEQQREIEIRRGAANPPQVARRQPALQPAPRVTQPERIARSTPSVDPRQESLPDAPELPEGASPASPVPTADAAPPEISLPGPQLEPARSSDGWRARRD